MLKKEKIVQGTMLEVLPVIQDGLPGFTLEPELHIKDNLLIARDPSNFLSNSWQVPSGTRLEVVAGPKVRSRVNTVIVRVCDEPEIEGHVFWCELRASTKIVTPAPTA